VDTLPAEEDAPSRPQAHQSSPSDTLPDTVETVPDVPISDGLDVPAQDLSLENDVIEYDEYDEQEAGDDFDEFVEEQDDMGDDDFGDFDDGFQEPITEDVDEPPSDSTTSQNNLPPVVSAHSHRPLLCN
jgi:hypothetical protein